MPRAWNTLPKCPFPKGRDQETVEPGLYSPFTETCTPAACTLFQRQPVPFQFGNGGRELLAASMCFQVNFFRWSSFILYIFLKQYSRKHLPWLEFLRATLSSALLDAEAGETAGWRQRTDLLTLPPQWGGGPGPG